MPDFKRLPPGDPVKEIFALLKVDPPGELLETAVPAQASLLQEAEPQEGELVLDLSTEFWNGSDAELRTRIGQVLFTMGGVEGGRKLTLLNGSVPARIPGAGDDSIRQPLTAEDWPSPTPLVQVAQPVPGAVVPRDVPVHVIVPARARVWGIVSVDEHLGGKTRLPNGSGVIDTGISGTKDAKIVFVVMQDSDRVSVSVPVTVAGEPRS